MRDLDKITAVDELLKNEDVPAMKEKLTEMWECWVTNDYNDNTRARERADMLYAYKYLKQFLNRISA
jgi:hypothetical protein